MAKESLLQNCLGRHLCGLFYISMLTLVFRCVLGCWLMGLAAQQLAAAQANATPLYLGQTFTLPSAALGEVRRINVYLPPSYTDSAAGTH
jgi:hypothetical protein